MKKLALATLLIATSLTVSAQSGTNSPYSMFGFGTLAEQGNSQSRGMNGLGIGFRERNQVNYQNPASYSALDSLSFIFDAGLSGQITNFNENGKKKNAYNADFEYVVAGFRLAPHLGASFGIIPFSNIGYSFSSTTNINEDPSLGTTAAYSTYKGNGGLHQVYGGLGWSPVKGFSFGVNFGYLWGNMDRTMSLSFSDSYINTRYRNYSAEVKSYSITAGAQYTFNVSKTDAFTLGATFTPGHKMKANAIVENISTNSQTSVSDTISLPGKTNGLDLESPTEIGAGLMWNHDNRWRVGIDYSLQKWSAVEYPMLTTTADGQAYKLRSNMFNDRHKLTLGGEYTPQENSRNFFKRIHYRFGASYATPYLRIADANNNLVDGPKEYSMSAGFGIPIINTYNNRSTLNISAQWVRRDATNMLKENTFRINIGLTFNENWFAKWKVK